MVDRFKSGKKRSADAQREMNKSVSKWGKSSTKRQASGLKAQAAATKARDKIKASRKS